MATIRVMAFFAATTDHKAATTIGFCYDQRNFLLRPSKAELQPAPEAVMSLLQPPLVFATTSKLFATSIHGGAATRGGGRDVFATTGETFATSIHSWLTGGRCLQNPVRRGRRVAHGDAATMSVDGIRTAGEIASGFDGKAATEIDEQRRFLWRETEGNAARRLGVSGRRPLPSPEIRTWT
ncbi:hypothetical protein CFC21_020553 [Triticum aestivum]|uniref:Uncharacterized protein n=2 Tax=Triticum aestivum TaxID=4565 RepID=A0A9R1E815_WHEAT|nr:hypothetical protein CFC21_020553 [Triticum aestivum]